MDENEMMKTLAKERYDLELMAIDLKIMTELFEQIKHDKLIKLAEQNIKNPGTNSGFTNHMQETYRDKTLKIKIDIQKLKMELQRLDIEFLNEKITRLSHQKYYS